jgi:hypothetical protein
MTRIFRGVDVVVEGDEEDDDGGQFFARLASNE